VILAILFLKTGSTLQFPWPYFFLWQNCLSEGFELFSSLSQKILLLCHPIRWCCQYITDDPELHLVPVQSRSVHGKWWGCLSTPGAVDSRCTGHPSNCGLYFATKGIEKSVL